MPKRRLVGLVKNNKADKTASVIITNRKKHKRYPKVVSYSKSYAVHDPENKAGIGDKVLIEEAVPVSKTKKWKLLEVIEKAA
jgi:small subunit ribosomal protein S17